MRDSPRAERVWVLVPASGVGSRFGSNVPKQYLSLAGEAVLVRTLRSLSAVPGAAALVVATQTHDVHWPEVSRQAARCTELPIIDASGGAERSHSVLNALRVVCETADPHDWALVHDAVRPCVREEDLVRLMQSVQDDAVGGLLAMPVRDTMKRADAGGKVIRTESRDGLWHALTPQVFRVGLLRDALESALSASVQVTDEAEAVERAGYHPRLVAGSADNIKITQPDDLRLAELFLRAQGALGGE